MSDGSVFVFKVDKIDSVHLASSDVRAEKESHERHLYLGVRGGVDMASETDGFAALDGPMAHSYGQPRRSLLKSGFCAGGQLDYNLDNTWALSAGLLYDQKGASDTHPEMYSGTSALSVTLNYLEIPILLKAEFGSGGFRPYLFAGPSFGWLLSGAERNAPAGYRGGGADFSVYQKGNYGSISAVAGAGFSAQIGNGTSIFCDASYAYGLTNDSFVADGTYSASSRDIRIAAGILFPLD